MGHQRSNNGLRSHGRNQVPLQNGDGSLDATEMEAAATKIADKYKSMGGDLGGATAADLVAGFVGETDFNGDGLVTFDEVWKKFVKDAGSRIDEDPNFESGWQDFKGFLDALKPE